jgi:ribosome biogenesis GTPase / thiamine phosphate phosphatase
MFLEKYGWNDFCQAIWAERARENCVPGRVLSQHRGFWCVASDRRESLAEASGGLRRAAGEGADWPAVGDWVAVAHPTGAKAALIQEVLPRRSKLVRKTAGKRVDVQVVAANVDTVLLVMGLDGDFNVRRIERYLAQCWESGARPVAVLNKADLSADLEDCVAKMERIALGVPILPLSARTGDGLEMLAPFVSAGQTLVLVGSSGAGKSTLVNRLLGEDLQAVQCTREKDDKGRHTTTARQLFLLPSGAMVIDTPGLRELQLWEAAEGVAQVFADLEAFAAQCRFRNCRHKDEPGCAVRAALEKGVLDADRLKNLHKLEREQAFLQRKVDAGARLEARQRIKTINRGMRRVYRQREREGGKA